MSDNQDKVKLVYLVSPDTCVACGRPTAPGCQICSGCMKYVKTCESKMIDDQFKRLREKNDMNLRLKMQRTSGLRRLFELIRSLFAEKK